MDPHFREYLAAVGGMQEIYGFADDHAEADGIDSGSDSCHEAESAVREPAPAGIVTC